MPNLNKNQYGQVIRANLGEDISTAIALNFVMEPKIGAKLQKSSSDGVTIGSINVVVSDETYLANQYLEYTTQVNDLTYAGQWRIKGEAILSSTNKVIGDYSRIIVMD